MAGQQDLYAASVLKGLGAPVNRQNIDAFIGWANAEGGDNWSRNNPLNTTESMGSTRTINSAGVKGYPTTQAGIAATLKTLRNGMYGGIIQAFKSSNPSAVGKAVANSPWGTGALAEQTIAAQAGKGVNLGGLGTLPRGATTLKMPKSVNPNFSPIQSTAPNVFNALSGLESTRQQILTNAGVKPTNPNDPVASGWQALSNLFSSQQSVTNAQQRATNRLNAPQTVGAAAMSSRGGRSAIPGPAAANKILGMARAAIGGPYNQGTHATAFTESAGQLRKTGTDCSGFVSWLMGPDGLGIWKNALATPDIPRAPGIRPGRGSSITIWNNPLPGNSGHVFIQIDGQYFQSAGGGVGIQPISQGAAAQMIRSGDNGARYYALHPKGF